MQTEPLDNSIRANTHALQACSHQALQMTCATGSSTSGAPSNASSCTWVFSVSYSPGGNITCLCCSNKDPGHDGYR
jgi:hypothetical protein